MTERIHRPKPESIPAPTAATRPLLGFEVRQIKKDGSRLEELKKGSAEAVLRHSELAPESMAGWQFLHSYATTVVDEEFAHELFGPTGKPWVAPIVQKDGRDRVRYEKGKAVAFAEIAGFDTEGLRNELDLKYEFGAYIQPAGMVDDRAGMTINYHLLHDLLREHPELDAEGRLLNSLEAMWDEFLKQNGKTLRGGAPFGHEVRAQDYDRDTDRTATLSLIKKAEQVSEELTRAYRAAKESGGTWQGKPHDRYLLMALHLNNMSVGHFQMWYLGFSHGHPHMRNCVSTINDPATPEGQDAPLTTSIIDFDQLTFAPEKLAGNDELFQHVTPEKILAGLRDDQLALPLKYQLLAYLPARHWDKEVREFVRTQPSPLRGGVCRALAYRAHKDTDSKQQYMQLLWLVYSIDVRERDPYTSALLMLEGAPALLDETHPTFGPAIRYLKTEEIPLSSITLTLPSSLLLLACMSKKHFEHYQKEPTLSPKELAFVVLEIKRGQEHKRSLAESILYKLHPYSGTDTIWYLLEKLDLDGPDRTGLLEGIILSARFERNDYGNSRDAYKELRAQIQKRTTGADRSKLLQMLNARAEERIDSGFVLRRKIGL